MRVEGKFMNSGQRAVSPNDCQQTGNSMVVEELLEAEKRADRVRAAFLAMPGLLESLRRAEDDVKAGRLISFDEIKRKHQIED
jgi:hypothetical protein